MEWRNNRDEYSRCCVDEHVCGGAPQPLFRIMGEQDMAGCQNTSVPFLPSAKTAVKALLAAGGASDPGKLTFKVEVSVLSGIGVSVYAGPPWVHGHTDFHLTAWLVDLMLLAAGTKPTLAGSNKLHHWGELRAEYALVGALAELKCPHFQASINHRHSNEDKGTEPSSFLVCKGADGRAHVWYRTFNDEEDSLVCGAKAGFLRDVQDKSHWRGAEGATRFGGSGISVWRAGTTAGDVERALSAAGVNGLGGPAGGAGAQEAFCRDQQLKASLRLLDKAMPGAKKDGAAAGFREYLEAAPAGTADLVAELPPLPDVLRLLRNAAGKRGARARRVAQQPLATALRAAQRNSAVQLVRHAGNTKADVAGRRAEREAGGAAARYFQSMQERDMPAMSVGDFVAVRERGAHVAKRLPVVLLGVVTAIQEQGKLVKFGGRASTCKIEVNALRCKSRGEQKVGWDVMGAAAALDKMATLSYCKQAKTKATAEWYWRAAIVHVPRGSMLTATGKIKAQVVKKLKALAAHGAFTHDPTGHMDVAGDASNDDVSASDDGGGAGDGTGRGHAQGKGKGRARPRAQRRVAAGSAASMRQRKILRARILRNSNGEGVLRDAAAGSAHLGAAQQGAANLLPQHLDVQTDAGGGNFNARGSATLLFWVALVDLGILDSVMWGRCFPGHTHNAADAANAAIAKARSGEQGGRHSAQAGTLGQERLHTTSCVDHTTPQAFLDSFPQMYAAPRAERVTALGAFASLRNTLGELRAAQCPPATALPN